MIYTCPHCGKRVLQRLVYIKDWLRAWVCPYCWWPMRFEIPCIGGWTEPSNTLSCLDLYAKWLKKHGIKPLWR